MVSNCVQCLGQPRELEALIQGTRWRLTLDTVRPQGPAALLAFTPLCSAKPRASASRPDAEGRSPPRPLPSSRPTLPFSTALPAPQDARAAREVPGKEPAGSLCTKGRAAAVGEPGCAPGRGAGGLGGARVPGTSGLRVMGHNLFMAAVQNSFS